MRDLIALGADAASVSLSDLRSFCREVLVAVPGGAAVVFDADLRVVLAEGVGFERAGLRGEDMVGKLLPEIVPSVFWDELRETYEGALAGRTSQFDFAALGTLFSIRVAPLVLSGKSWGALAVGHEITEQHRLESVVLEQDTAARASEQLLRSAFDRAPIGMTVVGPDGNWLRVNDEYCAMLGYAREDLIAETFVNLTHPDDVASTRKRWAAIVAGEVDSEEHDKRYLHKDGSLVWVHVCSQVIRDPAGTGFYVVAHIQDMTQRRAQGDMIGEQERTLRSVIDNTPALVYVKGRDFRYQLVNREFEEVFGVTSDWIVGRRDEDILPASVIDDIRAKDWLVLEGVRPAQELETVVRDGQERLYMTMRFPLMDETRAIHAVCAISTDVTERRQEEQSRLERLECSERIHSALAQDRFVLHGQPIVSLYSMEVERTELLIRMRRAPGGHDLLAPVEFLPAAERFGLIDVIDEWVVARAIEVAGAGHCVEVNLSAKTISDPAQVDRIEREIIASGTRPQNLIFEITETAVADNLAAARDFALRLRNLGCSFALDDFGVGHGTFTYLRHLPVDYLKIDLQFVRFLLSHEADRQVVQSMIGVAKQFEIKTIAEGVEDQATLDELRRLGVDYAQGYWISRPLPLAQLWDTSNDRPGEADAK